MPDGDELLDSQNSGNKYQYRDEGLAKYQQDSPVEAISEDATKYQHRHIRDAVNEYNKTQLRRRAGKFQHKPAKY